MADKTGKHWPVTFVGYAINLLAVPAMALAGSWYVAGALILAERIARAIRKPTVEAMRGERRAAKQEGFTRALYMVAAGCFGAGLMSYEFISFHLASRGIVTEHWIPFFLAIATQRASSPALRSGDYMIASAFP